MSALAIEAPYVRFVPEAVQDGTASDRGLRTGSAHPRGRGFEVLSRIARVQANDADYVPRHRLCVSPA